MNSHFFARTTRPQAGRAPRFINWSAGLRPGSIAALLHACGVAMLIAVLLTTTSGQAAETPQSDRFLLIFETSPAIKKNLPSIRQTLAKLLENNLQNEIQDNDDLAVWTVDQSPHPGLFPLESWTADDAAMYGERLGDFLRQQDFSRHADLAAVQPLLNRVAKKSERLTVLIFCDSRSRLLGTPYDSGVNETITNTAAKLKDGPIPLILVLRSYHGEYVGCSVNRSLPLNFPQFPPPAPKPEPVVNPIAAPALPPVIRPASPVVPSIIIVGTNVGNNVPLVPKPVAPLPSATAPALPPSTSETLTPVTPVGPPPSAAPALVPTPVSPMPESPPKAVSVVPAIPVPAPAPALPTLPPPPPAPVSPPPAKGLPILAPGPQTAAATDPLLAVSPPERSLSANPTGTRQSIVAGTVAEGNASESGSLWLWVGGGGFLAAAAFGVWLTTRARRVHPSLITSTMQEAPRWPPRK